MRLKSSDRKPNLQLGCYVLMIRFPLLDAALSSVKNDLDVESR
jgi:hypothetical protein